MVTLCPPIIGILCFFDIDAVVAIKKYFLKKEICKIEYFYDKN